MRIYKTTAHTALNFNGPGITVFDIKMYGFTQTWMHISFPLKIYDTIIQTNPYAFYAKYEITIPHSYTK